MWDPPVLIPNTEVKPHRADGTVRDTVWESRTLPHFIEKADEDHLSFLFARISLLILSLTFTFSFRCLSAPSFVFPDRFCVYLLRFLRVRQCPCVTSRNKIFPVQFSAGRRDQA